LYINQIFRCKGKKLRATLKEFLKKDENRNNLYFYKDYALIELEMGRFSNCINILKTFNLQGYVHLWLWICMGSAF